MHDNDPISPERQVGFELLLVNSLPDPAKVYNAVEAIRNMAVANIVARFESKMEALRCELSLLHWMFGSGPPPSSPLPSLSCSVPRAERLDGPRARSGATRD